MSATLRVKRLECVIGPERLAARVRELAQEIDAFYAGEPVVAVCVLKGACLFFSDLVRAMRPDELELDFVRLSSYGMDTTSSRRIRFSKDVEADIAGRHVLVVEDIVDSGHSMRFLLDQFAARAPRSLRLAALVDKRERREAGVRVDFAGFTVSSGFLVGYGLDYAERYRALPGIYELVPE